MPTAAITERLPPPSLFLETVCPGPDHLEDNLHFSLEDEVPTLGETAQFIWPLLESSTSTVKALMDPTYLNIARPPLHHKSYQNTESTTYVALPYHVRKIFDKVVVKKGFMHHIGANVNPLQQDPFEPLQLNPGCISAMIVLDNLSRFEQNAAPTEVKTSFHKMTLGLNRLLRMGVGESVTASHSAPLLNAFEATAPNLVFKDLLDHDARTYVTKLRLPMTSKLLVLANVNVVNVIGINDQFEYSGTTDVTANRAYFPLSGESTATANGTADTVSNTTNSIKNANSSSNNTSATSNNTNKGENVSNGNAEGGTNSSNSANVPTSTSCRPYTKTIEKPLLRFTLQPHLIVTSLLAFPNFPTVVLGLNSGAVIVLNLLHLTYRVFDNLGFPSAAEHSVTRDSSSSVTSFETIRHPHHELLLVVGYALGEIIILDPNAADSPRKYVKKPVGRDRFVTYFKKFDLSPLHKLPPPRDPLDTSPPYLVGHFKVSHKAITSIASTLSPDHVGGSSQPPMIIAAASEDGLVRIIDLIATHGANYGDLADFYNQLIVTDIIAGYFQDGVRSAAFSHDARFLCIAGKGDMIEVFKMTYYNVNSLVSQKRPGSGRAAAGRSRSGTINSLGSGSNFASSTFLSPINTTPSTSMDLNRDESAESHNSLLLPPTIKQISIVSRLKGHMNTVEKVSFYRPADRYRSHTTHLSTYKIISCGGDGRVMIWDLDYKALPRSRKQPASVPKDHAKEHSATSQQKEHLPSLPVSVVRKHQRAKLALSVDEAPLNSLFSALGINNLLSQTPPTLTPEPSENQPQILFSIYRSLYEVRHKRHYLHFSAKDARKRYPCVIHEVASDKQLPLIEIPLLDLDLSALTRQGRIQCCYINPFNMWVFTRSGDIFRYTLKKAN